MKKALFLAAILCVVMIMLAACTFLQKEGNKTAVASDGLAFESNGDGTCSVIGVGECTDTELIIPNVSPDGDRVVAIMDHAFSNFVFTSVVIPDSVEHLGIGAFSGCESLEKIEVSKDNAHYYSVDNCVIEKQSNFLVAGCKSSKIPDAVLGIGSYAFEGCSALTSITIPDSVTVIGVYAFSQCYGLESIMVSEGNSNYYSVDNCLIEKQSNTLVLGCKTSQIPDTVTGIGDGAFAGCLALADITIPDSVTRIGVNAFQDCIKLTSITIPDSVKSIGMGAFAWCSGLTSITIPNSVTKIGQGVLAGCTGLSSVSLPFVGGDKDNQTNAHLGYVFGDELGLPEALKVVEVTGDVIIEQNAFRDCKGLTEIVISGEVEYIAEWAFRGCSGLKSIVLGSGVRKVVPGAFVECTSLSSITVSHDNPIYHSINNCLVETALNEVVFGCMTSEIPDDGSITSIGAYAFDNCTGLTSITIPDSVTNIGNCAFVGCTGLTSIVIGNGIKNLDTWWSFQSYPNLVSVIIGDGVESIAVGIFENALSLETVVIGNGMKSIDFGLFWGCTTLKNVTIGNSVTNIDNNAFQGCTSLESIKIPDSVTRIASEAFADCTSLKNVEFGDGLEIIEPHAFQGCSSLASIVIPKNVINVEALAFNGCSSLSSITVVKENSAYRSENNCLISIQEQALILGCKTSVIPARVKSIGDYAFGGCTELTSFTIPHGITHIGNEAFAGCSNLKSIIIPFSVSLIGHEAFWECTGLTDIFYTGSESQWDTIFFVSQEAPSSATIHFNYVPEE